MDYQKARSIRKKSLLSLINQQKFGEGKSLGASIRGAASQKFKAKATGIKESLDPLNWVRKATGKGAFGDFAVTGLGRLFGRSDKVIKAFGGIGRKKIKGKKDPQFTTIAAGPIKPLKRGDGVADVLAKMYNFMKQNEEMHKLNHEIENAFKQEQLDEDDRRHKELVDTIKKYMKVPKTPAEEKKSGGGFFDGLLTLLDKVKGMIDGAIAGLKDFLAPIIEFMGNAVFKALEGAKWLVTALLTPAGMIAALGLGTLLALYRDKHPEETNKMIQNAANPAAESQAIVQISEETTPIERRKQNLLADRPSNKKSYLFWKEPEMQKKYLEEIGFDENTGLTKAERDKGFTSINDKGEPVKTPPAKTKEIKSNPQTNNSSTSKVTESKTPESKPVNLPNVVKSETPTAQPVQKSANPPVPETAPTQASTGGDSKPIISVNSSTNTIGDKSPPKVVQTNTAKARNNDLNRYLMAISVPV
jgi:hypothetical protein